MAHKFITVDQKVGEYGEDVCWFELITYKKVMLRLTICSHPCPSECFARLEKQNEDNTWCTVAYRPVLDMQTERGLNYHRTGNVNLNVSFSGDRNWLLAQFRNKESKK